MEYEGVGFFFQPRKTLMLNSSYQTWYATCWTGSLIITRSMLGIAFVYINTRIGILGILGTCTDPHEAYWELLLSSQ